MPAVHASLSGVSRVYPAGALGHEVHALGPIDLELHQGEFFAVVGPSGCGKSTLLDLIAGLAPASAGTIAFEGRAIKGTVPDGVDVVFQEDASFPWLTIADNIAFGMREAGIAAGERERRLDHALDLMGASRLRARLSGAALRRHAPARLHRPDAGAAARVRSIIWWRRANRDPIGVRAISISPAWTA
jgi:NitT/TauT family transport system ATP-binding protein